MEKKLEKLEVKEVVMFKHGVSYFILEGKKTGPGKFELEFKIDEMNDILKSLFVLDRSEKGYVSSISYDAAIETSQLLKTIMLDIPDNDSFSSLITQLKGAKIVLIIGNNVDKIKGTIVGIELIEKIKNKEKLTQKLLVLLKEDGILKKIPFSEISSFEILNEDLQKDLKFFLETVIAGKKKDSKKIVINCESGGDDQVERSILVSYIRESPVWKTSYRLIMSQKQAKDQKCLLSGWCMVENTTNQDWEEIALTLVAGMPVSFIYDFYRPIFINRPTIQPPKVLSARPTEIEEGMVTEDFKRYDRARSPAPAAAPRPQRAREKEAKPGGLRGAMPSSFAADMDDVSVMDKLKSQTKVQSKDLGELFEYKISNPVSIKRKHSALVPILTEEIKAKKILLYNSKEMETNPNACLEITNTSGLTLERGPVTIIYDNNLAGEAIVPFLNKDDTRILNYAVEQAVIIHYEDEYENRDVHTVQIRGSYIYEYYYTDLTTTYKIKNKTNEEKELYLDHPKKSGYKITDSPLEPEETANFWRFKLQVKSKESISFTIKERYRNSTNYYIQNYSKEDLLKRVAFYARQKFIDKQLEEKLREIGDLIGKKADAEQTKAKLEEERDEMTEAQERIRQNIDVLGSTTQENKLRERYVKKFTEQENRYESISNEISKLEKEIDKLYRQIEKKIDKLKVK